MAKRYTRINWQNKPNTATPISAENLNKMDKGIKDCDDAIGDLALLNTTNKTDLVAAVNELNNNLAGKLLGNYTGSVTANSRKTVEENWVNMPNGASLCKLSQGTVAYAFVAKVSDLYGTVIIQGYTGEDITFGAINNGNWSWRKATLTTIS